MQMPFPAAPPLDHQTFYSPLKYIALARCLYALLALAFSLLWILDGDTEKWIQQNTKLLLIAVIEIFCFTLMTCFALLRQKFMRLITYIGMLHDASFAALLVLLTAITTSPFTFLFLIVPLYGGLLMQKRGGLIAAGITIIAIFVLYLLLPTCAWLEGSFISYYIHSAGLSSENIPWHEATMLALDAVAIGLLTGQLASQYASVKTDLVITASEFAHVRGIYAKVLESLPVGVMILNKASKEVLFSNPAAKLYFSKDGDKSDFSENILENASQSRDAWEYTTKDGRILHISYFPIPIGNASEADGYHITDRTELRNAQQKMIQKKRLEHLGEFSAKVAHEIRNPLACISGCAEMLESDCDHPELKTVFEMMTTEIDRLNGLLKDILVFARSPRFNLEPCNVARLIENQKSIFMASSQSEQMTIDIHVHESVVIQTDAHVISQIVMTLWQNSLEATQAKGKIDVIITSHGIYIQDNGPGVPPEIEPHLFEPFFTTKTHGTGLGLATARQLARDLGLDLLYHIQDNQFEICFKAAP